MMAQHVKHRGSSSRGIRSLSKIGCRIAEKRGNTMLYGAAWARLFYTGIAHVPPFACVYVVVPAFADRQSKAISAP
jgi:hypothetical protein